MRIQQSCCLFGPEVCCEQRRRPQQRRCSLDAAMAEADAAELDDRMVLDGGCNLPRVPRLDHPECPIDIRYANALCTDDELVTCGAGEHQAPDR